MKYLITLAGPLLALSLLSQVHAEDQDDQAKPISVEPPSRYLERGDEPTSLDELVNMVDVCDTN